MVFHLSLRDSRSLQVSRTFLSIVVDLINAVVWIVSARPPISNSFSPFSKPLLILPSAPITIGITVTHMFHSFFSSFARSKYLFLFSFSLIFTQDSKVHNSAGCLFFFVNFYKVLSSGRSYVICLYFQIPENFEHLILLDGFWFVHIRFVCMVKFCFLAQFSADHFPYLVVSSLVLFLP